jgi:hypothetical protein
VSSPRGGRHVAAFGPAPAAFGRWLASIESNVLTPVLLVEALREAIERDSGRAGLLSGGVVLGR